MKYTIFRLELLLHLHLILTQAVSNNVVDTSITNFNIIPHRPHGLLHRAENSNACEDRCKKKCKGKRIKHPTDCTRCIPCPFGMKPDPTHKVCVKDNGDQNEDDDREKKRKGNCPGDTVLDPREGPQSPDTPAKDLKCAIDDEKDCKPPKIPETRPDGKENDANWKPKCMDNDEKDNPKCDEKTQFTEVYSGPDGKAKKKCKSTRQYQKKKKGRMDKLKEKFKKVWNDRKAERDKKAEERKSRQQKIDDGKREKQKKIDDDKKMRIKSYKCMMASVLGVGQTILGLKKRNDEVEGYMEMVACYFDQDFVESDDFLQFWPSDVNPDDIGPDIDEEAYMKQFMDRMEQADFEFWKNHDWCRRGANGTINARCQKKRGEEGIKRELEYENMRKRAEKLVQRNILNDDIRGRDGDLSGEAFCDMGGGRKRNALTADPIEKRNPFLIFVEIGISVARMAGSLLSRAVPQIARFSPRLAELMKNGGRNLFRLAPKGSGQAGSRQAMKDAFQKIANHPAFKKCLRDGKP